MDRWYVELRSPHDDDDWQYNGIIMEVDYGETNYEGKLYSLEKMTKIKNKDKNKYVVHLKDIRVLGFKDLMFNYTANLWKEDDYE